MFIKKKIHNTKKIYSDIIEYIPQLQDCKKIIINDIKTSIQYSLELIKQVDTLQKKIELNKSETPDSWDNLFHIWHLLCIIDETTQVVITALDDVILDNEYIITYMSQTRIQSINMVYKNIQAAHYRLKKSNEIDDVSIINDFSKVILAKINTNTDSALNTNTDSALNTFDRIYVLVKKYIYSISLFAYITQKILGHCKSDIILNKIEDVKNLVLTQGVEKCCSKNLFKTNPHIKTFGMTPKCPSDTLSNITNKIFQQKLSLSVVSKNSKTFIVILNRIIKNPIEFSLWRLFNWDYAKDYIQPDIMGINNNMIERFETISYIRNSNKPKWNFDIETYGDIDCDSVVVLETLDKDSYRILTPYTDDKIFKINALDITSFLQYVKNKGVGNTISRVSVYHEINQRKALQNMFLPIKFNVDEIKTDSSKIIDTKYLRNEITTQLLKIFNDIVKKDYSDGSMVKDNHDFSKIIHHDRLQEKFSSILIEQYDIYTFKNKENIGDFPFSETLKSFLSNIHWFNRSFVRNLHDLFIKLKIDKKIFNYDKTILVVELQRLFNDILITTVNQLISDDSNIYQSLIMKNNLLKLSLI
jgi:hypothetical protein